MNASTRRAVGPWALALAIVLAGCAKPAAPSIATAQPAARHGATATVSASPTADRDYDKARQFVRCMNDHTKHVNRYGEPIPQSYLPDPVEGKPLVIDTGGPFDLCKKFLPATWPIRVDPAEFAKERAFYECMYKRGAIARIPEMDAHGMVDYPADPAGSAEYQAAENACAYLVDDPATRGGS
jgi:hypothetical protein